MRASVGWAIGALVAAGAVGLTVAGLGFVIARRLTAPIGPRIYDLTVREVDVSGEHAIVVLDWSGRTAAPGLYCLLLEDSGWVKLSDEVVDRGPGLVGRVVVGESPAGLRAGVRASWSGIYFSSPADAGLASTDVEIQTDVGPAPAWLIPPQGESSETASSTWAIHIHGLGSPRSGTLRGVRVAVEMGLTSLVVSYRNDGEGPRAGTGRSTLGATEMDDVRAAVRFALQHGADRVILFGWSMGGAIAMQLAVEPDLRDRVVGLVLESPILDWRATIRANCVRVGLPAWVGFASAPWLDREAPAKAIGLPAPIGLDRFDWISRAADLKKPTLVLHGTADTSAPLTVAESLSKLSSACRLERSEAGHTFTWNSDPDRWQASVASWLKSTELYAPVDRSP